MTIDQDQFRAIISGRRRDAPARLARALLGVASLGYRLAMRIRNSLYDCRVLKSHRANAVVLCVGNLTTGGTGKTPLVAWLARYLTDKGLRVAILTRGYKAGSAPVGNAPPASDEPAELAAACPGVPVIVNPDRVAGATEAVRHHGAQVLVMDDGFQHRRLARDLDIIAIDATTPFGYGRLLPAGLLREPIGSLKRAHAVVITRSDQVPEQQLGRIEERIARTAPRLPVVRAVHAPTGAQDHDGSEIPLDALKSRKVFAFCGLGNPDAFVKTVETCGCQIAGFRAFNDHHAYTQHCVAEILEESRSAGAELALTTSKDWNKIAPLIPAESPLPMAYLAVALEFRATDKPLTTLIDRVLASTMAPS